MVKLRHFNKIGIYLFIFSLLIWNIENIYCSKIQFLQLHACGIWLMAYGLWLMAYGLWLMAYGVWRMAYGVSVQVKIVLS